MALIFDLTVIPSSGKSGCVIDRSGRLKCYLISAPERDKANNELIKYFAKKLDIIQSNISIVQGKHDRKKRIKIDSEISYEKLLSRLGIESQAHIFQK